MLMRGFLTLLCGLLASPAWAFPDNGVLDSFTGCTDTTTPPNANWTNAVVYGASSATMDCEDQAVTSTTTDEADMYWNPTTFNANSEAYARVVSAATTDLASVHVRLVNIGANTTDGYAVQIQNSDTVKIYRIDNGAATALGSNLSQTITNGDQFGIRAVGDQICAWFNDNDGGWTQLGCRTDATYTAGGRIGLTHQSSNGAIGGVDDFGGGNVTAVPAAPTALHLAGPASSTSATFIWAPNTETDLTGYKVYGGTVSGQTNTLLATITAASAAASHSSMTLFRHRRPAAGTMYYTVVAYNATGDSTKSSEISVTVAGMSARDARTTFTKRARIP
jgi:hypothetical protein